MKRIVLASQSPRRHEILEMAGVQHEVLTSDCDENIAETDPAALVSELSRRKAHSVAAPLMEEGASPDSTKSEAAGDGSASSGPAIVIGADTIVYFDGQILGKPLDAEDAFRMLKAMSGNTHTVFTGVTLIDTESGKETTFYEATKVTFYDVSEEEIKSYVATGDPLDKAGSYGVQGRGAFLVQKIEGDYFTVVGFPIAHFLQVLKEFQ